MRGFENTADARRIKVGALGGCNSDGLGLEGRPVNMLCTKLTFARVDNAIANGHTTPSCQS